MKITSIANIRADLDQIDRALNSGSTSFETGLLRHNLVDALRALSRATEERPVGAERAEYQHAGELLSDLQAIRDRLEQCLLAGNLDERAVIGEVGPALHAVASGVVDLIKIMARASVRSGKAG